MFATLSVASTFAAFAAAAPLLKRAEVPEFAFSHVALANTTFGNFNATQGLPSNLSCAAVKVNTDFTASIKTNSTNITEVCGQNINITNLDTGASVIATIVDECLECAYGYLALSPAAFANVSKAENFTASYVFTNASAPARAVAVPAVTPKVANAHGSTSSVDAPADVVAPTSSSSSKVHTPSSPSTWSSSSAHADAEKTSSSSSTSSSTKTWTPEHTSSSSSSSSESSWTPEHTSTSSSSKPEWTPSSSSSSSEKPQWTPETTTSSSKKAEWTPAPTTSSEKAQWTPEAKPQQQQSSGGSGSYSGTATYFYQGGNAGACGNVNSDSAYIVALQTSMYSGGSHCGQQVRIWNKNTGSSMTATVADECPSCGGSGDLDLSSGLFQALGNGADGVFPISWSFA